MSRFLVIEDTGEKLRQILQVFISAGVDTQSDVDIAGDVVTAQQKISAHRYDLAVLDLVLPIRPELPPDDNAGLQLLAEIHDGRGRYIVPGVIVGLTAFTELQESAASIFDEYLSTLLTYGVNRTDWQEKLRRRIRAIILRDAAPVAGTSTAALVVVTALHDPELAAVRTLPWEWQELENADPSSMYYEGRLTRPDGVKRVIAAAAPRMGMVPAAVLATKMIHQYRPAYLAMVGIMAGIEGECQLGDVICAETCWDWGSGKYTVVDGAAQFAQAPYQYKLDARLQKKFQRLASDTDTLRSIRDKWFADKPNSELKLHIGPVASGAAVVADDAVVKVIKKSNRKIIGIDMEAYSVFAAAEETIVPEPRAFVIKGVSDFGGEAKNDGVRRYAAFVSAKLLERFASQYL
jgi:nucleoside phosphorylase